MAKSECFAIHTVTRSQRAIATRAKPFSNTHFIIYGISQEPLKYRRRRRRRRHKHKAKYYKKTLLRPK